MFLNDKKTALKVDASTAVPDRRRKGHGFFTFANPANRKQRVWGVEAKSTEGIYLKADQVKSIGPLPSGVILLHRKAGAVVRTFLLGPKGIVSGLVN